MANIGVDIDGTATALPIFFSFLTKALVAAGHRVIIITYRMEQFRDITIADLESLGIAYTELHLCGEYLPAHIWKAKLAEELQLDMMFEDASDNLAAMPPRVARVWVGQQLQDMTIDPQTGQAVSIENNV